MNTWHSLDVPRTELRLNTTLKCGQSFRWRTTGENEWSGVLRDRIITLQQSDHDVLFKADEGSVGATREILKDYFQLEVNLEALYAKWNQDQNFKKKSGEFAGIRILRQDPLENLFAFICSSNNSISRITMMVNKMSERWGTYIGTVEGDSQPYYSFPTLSRLAEDGVESELRNLGFGYRAKYIAQTAKYILQNHDEKWLESLRYVEYAQCREELMKLSGVGPKVADCVCLMSLDKHESIPVDTHVWQIAKRDYKISGLAAAKSMTPKNYLAIGDFFREIFGDYAGWAHSVIFTADLRQFGEKSRQPSLKRRLLGLSRKKQALSRKRGLR
ncbi:hypothetical protein PhCBS80983_g02136 [Powellomyces hirtus]|uniref:N-glycosylase/DNA lyase n=1 Tax=Powellomyces hirtus TaxID=109895 RepID=A0A507EA31_9FUNG|nr:hypothetical protein PhCBS80983_g02136 [Powellomyces hirtus]